MATDGCMRCQALLDGEGPGSLYAEFVVKVVDVEVLSNSVNQDHVNSLAPEHDAQLLFAAVDQRSERHRTK